MLRVSLGRDEWKLTFQSKSPVAGQMLMAAGSFASEGRKTETLMRTTAGVKWRLLCDAQLSFGDILLRRIIQKMLNR